MSSLSTNKHRDVFNWVRSLPQFKYQNKQIAQWAGFEETKLSRFFTGKRDLNSKEFFHLLESMPESFQEVFWTKYDSVKLEPSELQIIVDDLDLITLGELLIKIGQKIEDYRQEE